MEYERMIYCSFTACFYMNFDDNEEGIENNLYLGFMELDILHSVLPQS